MIGFKIEVYDEQGITEAVATPTNRIDIPFNENDHYLDGSYISTNTTDPVALRAILDDKIDEAIRQLKSFKLPF